MTYQELVDRLQNHHHVLFDDRDFWDHLGTAVIHYRRARSTEIALHQLQALERESDNFGIAPIVLPISRALVAQGRARALFLDEQRWFLPFPGYIEALAVACREIDRANEPDYLLATIDTARNLFAVCQAFQLAMTSLQSLEQMIQNDSHVARANLHAVTRDYDPAWARFKLWTETVVAAALA